MVSKIIFTFLLLCSVNSRAQFLPNVVSYYYEINAAKICFAKKDYTGSVNHYEKAIKYQQPQKEEISQAAYWYELAKDSTKALNTFYASLLTGCENTERNYPEFISSNTQSPQYKKFVVKADSLYKTFLKKSNVPFSLFIKALYTKDQYIRQDIFLDNPDSNIKKFAWGYLYTSDTLSMNELLAYINEYGVPDARTLSDEILTNFKMVVHHNIASPTKSANKEKLRAIITQAVHDGKLPNIFLYNALDYEQVLLGKKELYGTYASRTGDRKMTYSNLADISHLDERRAEWLLLPLYWSMRFNFEDNFKLPEGYSFKE